jgi:hypothetical protein
MRISGETIVKRIVVSEGAGNLLGAAICKVKYTLQSGGSLSIGGSGGVGRVNSFYYSANGAINLSGSSGVNHLGLGFLDVEFSSEEAIIVTPVFPVSSDAGIPILTPDSGTISIACSPTPLSLLLFMSHNLMYADGLKQFLSKNGFKLNEIINLVYDSNNNTWRFNQEWIDNNESWTLVVEVGCVNTIAGSPVD